MGRGTYKKNQEPEVGDGKKEGANKKEKYSFSKTLTIRPNKGASSGKFGSRENEAIDGERAWDRRSKTADHDGKPDNVAETFRLIPLTK